LDFGIVGVSGIDEDGSLLDFDYQEARNAEAILANSRQTILVTGHTKFGRRATTRCGHMQQIHRLCTDVPPPEPYATMLQEFNTNASIIEEAR
jgi:DeoR family transcriptional regulator, glycerol-3-phosphate regulon repressor